MSDTDTLRWAVKQDLSAFEARFDEIRDGLASSDARRRIDAGRAVRIAAKADPTVVEPHYEILRGMLADDHDSIRLSGATGIAELAAESPEAVSGSIPDLIALLEETHAPALEEATLRALTRIGVWSPEAVAEVDDLAAEHLRNATTPIRTMILSYFVDAVAADPSLFPATISAMEEALKSERKQERHNAGIALATIAAADPTAVSSVDAIYEKVAAMAAATRSHPMKRGGGITEAAETLQALREERD